MMLEEGAAGRGGGGANRFDPGEESGSGMEEEE